MLVSNRTICAAVAGLLIGCASEVDVASNSAAVEGEQDGWGAMSCDFDLPLEMDASEVPPIIERDRMYMADRPGFENKHIPFSLDPLDGHIQTGGRYIFESYSEARNYLKWVEEDFVLDGVHFLDRDYFLNPVCRAYWLIGAHYFEDIDSHYLMRTERFVPPPEYDRFHELYLHWPTIRAEAEERGLAGVSFAYSVHDRLVEIVHYANRSDVEDLLEITDGLLEQITQDLLELASSDTLGLPLLEQEGMTQDFDRSQFVLTSWFPFEPGDHGEPSWWGNSPPFPAPSCDDGVCEVSRGEDHNTCASDCPLNCGDTVCQPAEGEDTHSCPGDCRL